MNYKRFLNREMLAGEFRHYANKGYSFQQVWSCINRDYNIQAFARPDTIKRLEYNYNTLLFMVEERKNKYGRAV